VCLCLIFSSSLFSDPFFFLEGREFRQKGADVAFGPGLNVGRLPWYQQQGQRDRDRNGEIDTIAPFIRLSSEKKAGPLMPPPPPATTHRGGRNFEYLAGEDPFLGYELAYAVTGAMQRQGVIANGKVRRWLSMNVARLYILLVQPYPCFPSLPVLIPMLALFQQQSGQLYFVFIFIPDRTDTP
jgi:hypothetical protein